MNKIIIIPNPLNPKDIKVYEAQDLNKFLFNHFNGLRPENLKIYHNGFSEENNVTPNTVKDIKKLAELKGTFYVVIYPAYGAIEIAIAVIAIIMAAVSIYMIATMPKPQTSGIQSSNNELANRTNKARIKSRIPDIFGQVRAYPDLIAQPYSFYNVDGVEVEECLMCIGRGYFKIHDVCDGVTDVSGIDGVNVSVFDPGVDITSNETTFKTGVTFNDLPLLATKSTAINGQSLVRPGDRKLQGVNLYFTSGGNIKRQGSTVDFTDSFKVGDTIGITGAQFGVDDFSLTGSITVRPDFTVQINTSTVLSNLEYKGLLLTGAAFNVDGASYDLSGQYTVDEITDTKSDIGHLYTISLSSPKQANYNWNYITQDVELTAGILLNKNAQSLDLDEAYTIGAISNDTITLENANKINDEWDKLATLMNGTTKGQTSDIDLEIIASKWVGWFKLFAEHSQYAYFNIYFQQGLYNVDKKGRTNWAFVDVTIEYQLLDSDGNIISDTQQFVYKTGHVTKKKPFGVTQKIALGSANGIRFRIAKTNDHRGKNPMTECKIKDVYLMSEYDKRTYEGITVVRSRTVATDGALSVKERKLNMLVTRKLAVDGTGELVPTKDAGQALINLALDPYIGRRQLSEIDIEQIKAEIQKVITYFGSNVAAEFSYTIDDDNLSFEEQASMVASACFCESQRFGNKLQINFEAPQEISVLLFNHRNKKPGSEKRTRRIVSEKRYDGVELEYTSPDDDIRTTYQIPTDGSAKNPMKITTTGIRNHAVAKTRAWREWNKVLFGKLSCEFIALDESSLLARNDRILVADNTRQDVQDGQVEAQDVLTLTLSQDVILKANERYYCYLQMSDGTVDMIECFATEYTNEITLARAPLKNLVVQTGSYVHTLYTIVHVDDVKKDAFLMVEMSPNDQMTNKLTCVNYDERFYEKDHSFI